MTFQEYLQTKALSNSSIQIYSRYLSNFHHWLETESLSAEKTTYTDLLAYIEALREQGLHPKTINQQLGSLRHYYQYLIHQGRSSQNPAQGLYLKGIIRTVPHHLLSEQQLQAIEASYQPQNLAQARNQVMLSLIIHQALRLTELEQLPLQALSSTQLQIPASQQSTARCLMLQQDQPQLFQDYLHRIRPMILAQRSMPSDHLILNLQDGKSLKNALYSLMSYLRRLHPYLKNASQLRQSRIRLWLETYDLRQVQHKAGHKYISSTERYAFQRIKELQKQLRKFHPMGQ